MLLPTKLQISMTPTYRFLLFTTALGASVMMSCNLPKHATVQPSDAIPVSFNNSSADSNSMAMVPMATFYKDSLLRMLIDEVLTNNTDINIAIQNIEMSRAYFRSSRTAFAPTLSGLGSASATTYGKYTMEGVGNQETNATPGLNKDQIVGTHPTPNYWLGLNSTWELDFWGKLRHQKKAARSRLLASQQGKNWMVSQLVALTARLYYELITLDNESNIIDENIKLQEHALRIVEAQKEAGRATELAVQQFNAQMLNTETAKHKIRQQIRLLENQLNQLRGKYTGEVKRSKLMKFNLHFEDYTEAGIPTDMLTKRMDVQQAFAALKASQADALAARAALFPSVSLSGYLAFNAFNGNLLFTAASLGNQLLGGVTAPLFQHRQLRTQYLVRTAEQKAAFYHYQKVAINAYQEVANHLFGIESYKKLIALKKEEVIALDKGVGISEDLYLTGYATYLEIVAAQKSKLEAQLELLNFQMNRIHNHIDLYKSLGGGWQ